MDFFAIKKLQYIKGGIFIFFGKQFQTNSYLIFVKFEKAVCLVSVLEQKIKVGTRLIFNPKITHLNKKKSKISANKTSYRNCSLEVPPATIVCVCGGGGGGSEPIFSDPLQLGGGAEFHVR